MFVGDDVIIEDIIEERDAKNLSRDDIECLFHWTDRQYDHLFQGIPLQEILDLYHASSKYRDFQDWYETKPAEASKAYNRIVKNNNRRIIIQ